MAFDRGTRTQLDLLREIDAALRRAGIRYWLRGGWALDFLQGRVTRAHADLDLVAWKRHERRLRGLLAARGFRVAREGRVREAAAYFAKRGQELAVVFARRDARGRIVTAGIPEWRWSARALSSHARRLAGLACRVVAARQLLAEERSYERGTGKPLRPKDRASIRALRALLSAPAPARPPARAASRRATARRC